MAETVRIEGLGGNGDGIVETPAGRLFVPFGLQGERVEIALETASRARLVSVLEPSPDRADPICPVFGRCGGCVTQHMAPALYAGWKRDRVVEALGRAGVAGDIPPLLDAHGGGRRRVVLHGRRIEGRMQVGFMERSSHRLVEIERCPVTVPELARAPAAARAVADVVASTGKPLDLGVTATAGGLDIDLRGTGRLAEPIRQRLVRLAGALDLARLSVHGEALIERRPPAVPMGRAFCIPPPGGFLQPTAAGEEALAAEVLAGIGRAKRVADLFAGSGPFALRLAERAEVHAVETDPAMLRALDRAARATPGLRRITTEARDLFRRPLLAPELDRFDAVVLDPPRAGAEAQVRQLIPSSCETVIMVSCDPASFARDAALLVEAGFGLGPVVPIDQFRWSPHVEIVARFTRPEKGRSRRR